MLMNYPNTTLFHWFGTKKKICPNYSLLQTKPTIWHKYIDGNIAKTFIECSRSPIGAPILFVKK
jgi:hypothetical protein